MEISINKNVVGAIKQPHEVAEEFQATTISMRIELSTLRFFKQKGKEYGIPFTKLIKYVLKEYVAICKDLEQNKPGK